MHGPAHGRLPRAEDPEPGRGGMAEPPKVDDARSTVYYTTLLESWFETRFVKDKTLLTLSAGGIGLLATLLTAYGVESRCQLVLYALAALAFTVALLSVVWIFDRNATYLQQEKEAFEKNQPPIGQDPLLVRLDTILVSAFIVGAVLTFVVALSSAWTPRSTKEKAEVSEQRPHETTTSGKVLEKKSLSNASSMRPSPSPTETQPAGQPSGSQTGSGQTNPPKGK